MTRLAGGRGTGLRPVAPTPENLMKARQTLAKMIVQLKRRPDLRERLAVHLDLIENMIEERSRTDEIVSRAERILEEA